VRQCAELGLPRHIDAEPDDGPTRERVMHTLSIVVKDGLWTAEKITTFSLACAGSFASIHACAMGTPPLKSFAP